MAGTSTWLISLFMTLLLPASAVSGELELDITHARVEHAWRGERNYAQFTSPLYGLGLTYWFDNGFGVRGAYAEGREMHTDGRFKDFTIDLKYIASLELLYRYEVVDGLFLVGGVGTHVIPLPIWNGKIDYRRNDYDNDEGYILGIQYRLNDNFSVGWRFTHYSRVKSDLYDEWTKGHSINLTYRW